MGINQDIVLSDHLENSILRLTLNKSESQNTLSEEMMAVLRDLLDKASTDDSVRVIIIAAKGSVFCAGHDLKEMTKAREMSDAGQAYYEKLFDSCSSLMQAIVNHPKPIIAEVDGIATAAGCQLVASCDLAISSNTSAFATPGVNIGLFCSTPMVALSRNVAHKHAMEMLLTGDLINPNKAKEIGLINNHVDQENLNETVMNLAIKISKKSTMTVKIGKEAFYNQSVLNLSEAYKYTSKVMVENMLKDDAKEGINAFIEKRDPEWKDN